jgi:AraC-like DNA-binding protein
MRAGAVRGTEVAAAAGVPVSRLTHLFTQQVGIPLRRYVLWLRLRIAITEELAFADLTDAAQCAAFADSAHLTRTCRDMFGLPPSVLSRRERLGRRLGEGAALPTEEAARRIRFSFSFRDRRAIRRGVDDHVAAPRQGHTGRRRRGGRRGNDDPMIRKIRSAVAILLPVSINRYPTGTLTTLVSLSCESMERFNRI